MRVLSPLVGILLSLTQVAISGDSMTPTERKDFEGVVKQHSRKIKGNRKVDIPITAAAQGITSGCVIAYGHRIPPPYSVTSSEGRIKINGVQIYPSLVLERDPGRKIPRPHPETISKQNGVRSAVDNQYYAGKQEKRAISRIKEEILEHLKNQDSVGDAHWEGDSRLLVRWKENRGYEEISFQAKRPTNPMVDKSREVRQLHEKRIRDFLQSNRCVIYDSDGMESVVGDPKKSVMEIMTKPNLPISEKADALAKELGGYSPALDLIENFSRAEWDER